MSDQLIRHATPREIGTTWVESELGIGSRRRPVHGEPGRPRGSPTTPIEITDLRQSTRSLTLRPLCRDDSRGLWVKAELERGQSVRSPSGRNRSRVTATGKRRMQTPLGWFATKVEFGPTALRRAAIGSVLVTMAIVVGGAVVRVTGSGLGCPTWPSCVDGSLGPTPEMGIHGVIEFGNRLLTWVLCIAVGIVIVVSRCQRPLRRDVLRMAWLQFWIVVLNAVVGGLTVLARLSPYMVAAHFIAAMLLLTAAVRTYDLVEKHADTPVPAGSHLQAQGRVLLSVTAVLVLLGTVVTGTGVHAGDSADVHRIPLNWTAMTIVHGSAATVVVVLAVLLYLRVRTAGAPRLARSAGLFVVLLLMQGAIGVLQAVDVAPEPLIVLHLLGSSLIWAGVLRILFEINRMEACRRMTQPPSAVETTASC